MGRCPEFLPDLNIGNRKGWRLPTVQELATLVDPSEVEPSLPSGHPFDGVMPYRYWSSDEYVGAANEIWSVHMYNGKALGFDRDELQHVWPVRGGN